MLTVFLKKTTYMRMLRALKCNNLVILPIVHLNFNIALSFRERCLRYQCQCLNRCKPCEKQRWTFCHLMLQFNKPLRIFNIGFKILALQTHSLRCVNSDELIRFAGAVTSKRNAQMNNNDVLRGQRWIKFHLNPWVTTLYP